MPHERGPTPVLPSEFVCPVLADPKARFYRDSPATPPSPMDACLTNKQTTDTKALNHLSASASGGYALISDTWAKPIIVPAGGRYGGSLKLEEGARSFVMPIELKCKERWSEL